MLVKMNTRTRRKDGEVMLITQNEKLQKNVFMLYKILNKEIESEYITFKGYGRNFGSPCYTFEFWGFDSFEEALEAEVKYFNARENKIVAEKIKMETTHPFDNDTNHLALNKLDKIIAGLSLDDIQAA